MSKFKPGDKVKVIDSTFGASNFAKEMVGKVCEIKNYDITDNSYELYEKDSKHWAWLNESDLEPVTEQEVVSKEEKTLDNLEVGDILVNEDGEKRKVLGICGLVYFLSLNNKLDIAGVTIWTIEEIKENYTLDQPTPELIELTHQQIADKFGIEVSKLRVKE